MKLTFAERVLHAKVIACEWDCTYWGIAYPAGSGQWIVEPVGTREMNANLPDKLFGAEEFLTVERFLRADPRS